MIPPIDPSSGMDLNFYLEEIDKNHQGDQIIALHKKWSEQKQNGFNQMDFLGVKMASFLFSQAQVSVPNVEKKSLNPHFWINRHPNPNSVILTKSQIQAMNQKFIQKRL